MSPAKMRFVLALSLFLGVATTINVLGHGDGGGVNTNVVNPAGPVGAPSRRLVRTSAGESARVDNLGAIRRELMTRGYLAKAGGEPLDARTRAAILAFEYDHGLTLTATPSEALLKSLIFETARAKQTAGARPMTSEAVTFIKELQRALERVGFLKAGVSGRIDGATRSAIRAFERDRGMQSTGRVSAVLVDSLGPAFPAR
jgi:hypothetical protein